MIQDWCKIKTVIVLTLYVRETDGWTDKTQKEHLNI